ncbi:MAG: ribonuclease HI family protein [Candidatus Caldarchaeales archaeon]|nr:ribonuclease HI family protein [Candidatus Caldarchaeales archaeon]MDT7915473.1 ribonuclease HI family protein [Candidatus Caldarchaeales archaeon]
MVVADCEAYIDGASSGNPGPAAYAYVIRAGGRVYRAAGRLGVATNNVAEYHALIRCLRRALRIGCRGIVIYSDSELLVRQMSGEYAVRSPHLLPLHEEARRLASGFASFRISHVPREANSEADRLVKRLLSVTRRGQLR